MAEIHRMVIDRNKYITQLQANIDHFTTIGTEGSSGRLEDVVGRVSCMEEQITNIIHFLKLLQTNADRNEKEFHKEIVVIKEVVRCLEDEVGGTCKRVGA